MEIHEGSAVIEVPDAEAAPGKSEAFYNPAMHLNRDLSMAVARTVFSKSITICEPFAATGVRAIRYAKEVSDSVVYAGDFKLTAFELAQKNIALNECLNVELSKIAAEELLPRRKYDLIDLDPFGTSAPYFEAALKGSKVGTVLGFTGTDMQALCGVQPKAGTPMPKYDNAKAIRADCVHEVAARLVLGFLAKKAAEANMGIIVLLTLSREHYLRFFVQLKAKKKPNIGFVTYCAACGFRSIVKRAKKTCSCGETYAIAGPLWAGKLFDKPFLKKLKTTLTNDSQSEQPLGKVNELHKLVDLMIDESDGKPLYFDAHELYRGGEIPKMDQILKDRKATRTHFKVTGVRNKS